MPDRGPRVLQNSREKAEGVLSVSASCGAGARRPDGARRTRGARASQRETKQGRAASSRSIDCAPSAPAQPAFGPFDSACKRGRSSSAHVGQVRRQTFSKTAVVLAGLASSERVRTLRAISTVALGEGSGGVGSRPRLDGLPAPRRGDRSRHDYECTTVKTARVCALSRQAPCCDGLSPAVSAWSLMVPAWT